MPNHKSRKLGQKRHCKVCGKEFTWRDKQPGQIYCSNNCASTEKHSGRPSSFTQEVVNKLEQAFAIGCPVTEACIYADITKQTFYNNCKEGTELFDRFMSLRERPVLKARQTIVQDLGNPDTAFKYLRAKRKDEFSERNELTGKDGEAVFIIKKIDERGRDTL